MIPMRRLLITAFIILSAQSSFGATWYEEYEDGIKAARARNWQLVIRKMDAAIAQKPREGPREKTYGVIFIAYYPFYYRGLAHYELREFRKAINDLELTKGAGPFKPQDAETMIRKAKENLEGERPVVRPTPTPAPPPPTPTPGPIATPTPRQTVIPLTTPTARPLADTSTQEMERRARGLLNDARSRAAAARQQRADSLARQDYVAGSRLLSQAEQFAASASTLSQWQRVVNAAEAARIQFETSITVARGALRDPVNDILADVQRRVKSALDNYFSGKFPAAAAQFEEIARSQGDNALIWAFLGAAHYSEYYIEGETDARTKERAIAAFRKAKRNPKYRDLPANYFSPRIRRFYRSVQ